MNLVIVMTLTQQDILSAIPLFGYHSADYGRRVCKQFDDASRRYAKSRTARENVLQKHFQPYIFRDWLGAEGVTEHTRSLAEESILNANDMIQDRMTHLPRYLLMITVAAGFGTGLLTYAMGGDITYEHYQFVKNVMTYGSLSSLVVLGFNYLLADRNMIRDADVINHFYEVEGELAAVIKKVNRYNGRDAGIFIENKALSSRLAATGYQTEDWEIGDRAVLRYSR